MTRYRCDDTIATEAHRKQTLAFVTSDVEPAALGTAGLKGGDQSEPFKIACFLLTTRSVNVHIRTQRISGDDNMKGFRILFVCFLAIVVLLSGISPAQAKKEPEKIKVKVTMKTGDEVTFFYGGSDDIKQVFPVGEVVKVYEKVRAWRSPGFYLTESDRIGKVKILEHIGDNYFRAQVVEGTVKAGDVVKLKPGPGPAGMVVPDLPNK